MNSLILTLDAGAGCCLPIAYQQLTQGALYAAWRGSYPQLHDDGFDGDGQIFRLFTFGPLEGRYRVQGNEITFTDLVRLEVRSPVEDLLYALGKSLTENSALRLGRCVLPLRDLYSEDHYWFAAPAGDTVQGHLPDRLGREFSAGRRPGDALPFVPDRLGGPQQPGLWHVPATVCADLWTLRGKMRLKTEVRAGSQRKNGCRMNGFCAEYRQKTRRVV